MRFVRKSAVNACDFKIPTFGVHVNPFAPHDTLSSPNIIFLFNFRYLIMLKAIPAVWHSPC